MKKTLALSILLTTSVMATPFNGFYLGFMGGATLRDIKFKLMPISSLAQQTMSTYESDYTKYGVLVGSYVGYGKTFDNIYFGGEASIHYDGANGWESHSNTLKDTNIKINYKSQYKKDWVFGVAVRLGILATNETLVYIKPALEFSRDKLTIKNYSDQDSVSANKIKFSPGIGVEHIINKHTSLRLEYACSFGTNGKIKRPDQETDLWVESGHISHAVKAGVSYSF